MSRERPIIFSADMVRAILDGRKTQTRRLAWRRSRLPAAGKRERDDQSAPSLWQRARPGDTLWVREAWGINDFRYLGTIPKQRPVCIEPDALIYFATETDAEIAQEMPITSPIHMPRWASRITLRVTATRVARLHDISEADAFAEGCRAEVYGPSDAYDLTRYTISAREAFSTLWQRLHGPGSWDNNPEVVAITFETELPQ